LMTFPISNVFYKYVPCDVITTFAKLSVSNRHSTGYIRSVAKKIEMERYSGTYR
jgi:hypothetical protein